jgi:hypothetical protein
VPWGPAIPNYYPSVIDPEIFWRAQGVLEGRNVLKVRGREGKDVANLFTGLLWCADDGAVLEYKNTTAGKYLNSKNANNGKAKGNGFKYDIFETEVLRFLKDELTLESPDTSKKRMQVEALQAEIGACTARIERAMTSMATCDDEDVHANLAEVLAQMTKQKKALQQQLDKAKAEAEQDTSKELRETRNLIKVCFDCNRVAEVSPGPAMQVGGVADYRAQLKNKLRGLLSEVWVSIRAEGWRRKTATVEFHFKQGTVRALEIRVEPDGVTAEPLLGSGLKYRGRCLA